MRALTSVARLAFLASWRSHPLRALLACAILASVLAPSLVAFAFSGAAPLAVAGALGSACLFGPIAALAGGIALGAGDRGGEGLAPVLRGGASAGGVLAAAALGISAAATLGIGICAAAAALSLAAAGIPAEAGPFAGSLAAAAAAGAAGAAGGLLLSIAAPRPLALALGGLFLGAAFLSPAAAAAGGPRGLVPPAGAVLLARDAAFGALPAGAVLLSCAASLAAAGAAIAAGTALLRAKDLAPRPGRP